MRSLNVRALLDSSAEDLPGLRDRALLSARFNTGLRASELGRSRSSLSLRRLIRMRGC